MKCISNKMKSIPVDIVNYICELAAGKDKVWYPFFSPKTGEMTWKVNPYCSKSHQLARKFLNEIDIVPLLFYNVKTGEEMEIECKVLRFRQSEIFMDKLYIEFDLDNNIYSSYMIRSMIHVMNHDVRMDDVLYVNGTPYASINFGWVHLKYPMWDNRITIGYEMY